MGLECPVCRSTDIEGYAVEIDAGMAWQPVGCLSCGAAWNDVYQLAGFSELVGGAK
jgi:hypothetical protein